MFFFRNLRRKKLKYIVEFLGPKLCLKYGVRNGYSKEELDWLIGTLDKRSIDKYKNDIYGLYLDSNLYISLGMSSMLGERTQFLSDAGHMLSSNIKISSVKEFLELSFEYASNGNEKSTDSRFDGNDNYSGTPEDNGFE